MVIRQNILLHVTVTDSAYLMSLQGKSAHYPFPHARIKLQRDPKDRSVSGKCNLSLKTQCCAAWLPDMLQQCRQTFRTAAPDKRGSVCLPGHRGEMPEAYVYANIRFTMLRLNWHSFILCLLLNNTLALLQFPFSVLLWHSILPHHCTPNVNRHESTEQKHISGLSPPHALVCHILGVVDSP